MLVEVRADPNAAFQPPRPAGLNGHAYQLRDGPAAFGDDDLFSLGDPFEKAGEMSLGIVYVVDSHEGFALADRLAPLVFVNGTDTKAAQMFTLAHELAHVWLGQSALSDVGPISAPSHRIEIWCNRVAAELLVPLATLREEYQRHAELSGEVQRLARRFKVSTLVILRRIYDAGGLTRDELWQVYSAELERLRAIPRKSGGDFYLTLGARVSKRFARALVVSTLEGRTSFTEAFRMLGVKRMAAFQELGHSLGVGG
jgi:Zn-dependent peptidase ImmA (M78 family)